MYYSYFTEYFEYLSFKTFNPITSTHENGPYFEDRKYAKVNMLLCLFSTA